MPKSGFVERGNSAGAVCLVFKVSIKGKAVVPLLRNLIMMYAHF